VVKGMAAALCFSTVLYTMTCCLAPSRSGEAFVGLTGILVLLVITLGTMAGGEALFSRLNTPTFRHSVLAQTIAGICPFYLFDIRNTLMRPWPGNLLYFEQGALVVLVLWFGYWKWRRRN
jgi:hypothetical protein